MKYIFLNIPTGHFFEDLNGMSFEAENHKQAMKKATLIFSRNFKFINSFVSIQVSHQTIRKMIERVTKLDRNLYYLNESGQYVSVDKEQFTRFLQEKLKERMKEKSQKVI